MTLLSLKTKDPATTPTSGEEVSTQDIKQKMSALKAQVKETAVNKKEEGLETHISKRDNLVREDERILTLLKDAKDTIQDFENQLKQRIALDQEDWKEFGEVKTLIADLKKERDTEKSNAEYYQKALELMGQNVIEELETSIDEFLKELEALEKEKGTLEEKSEEQQKISDTAKIEAEEIIAQAAKKLTPTMTQTAAALNEAVSLPSYKDYLDKLTQYKKSLGWFKFKEKSVINDILKQRDLFENADTKALAERTTESQIQEVDSKIQDLITKYKKKIFEAEKTQTTTTE
jgi:hypothetical protein